MSLSSIQRCVICSVVVFYPMILLAAFSVHAVDQTSISPSASPPSVDAQPSTATQVVLPPPSQPSAIPVVDPTLRIYMPDGQLKSHSVRVYLACNITTSPGKSCTLHETPAPKRSALGRIPKAVAPGPATSVAPWTVAAYVPSWLETPLS